MMQDSKNDQVPLISIGDEEQRAYGTIDLETGAPSQSDPSTNRKKAALSALGTAVTIATPFVMSAIFGPLDSIGKVVVGCSSLVPGVLTLAYMACGKGSIIPSFLSECCAKHINTECKNIC